MNGYNELLRELRRQTERKRHLEAILPELYARRDELEERVDELEAVKLTEQADVDRLEGHSLAAFFYGVIGRMDEKLDKERGEAYAARVKYDAAAGELAAVREQIERSEAELASLQGCQERFERLLREKAESLRRSGGAEGNEFLRLEKRLAFLAGQKQELLEAVTAGQDALETARAILSSLNSAQGWGTWDLLGGGLLADIAKHSHLDEAQAMVQRLQGQLRAFRTELADVDLSAGDLRVSIDGFLRFADYFFDGLFADWAVMDRINRSKEQVSRTVWQLEAVLDRLSAMLGGLEQERAQVQARLDDLVLRT